MVKIARMRTPRGRSETKIGTIYIDKAGNKLVKRWIKTRNSMQYSAYNRQGRLINPSGLRTLIRKAKQNKKFY